MDCGFQVDAFQQDAFQMCVPVVDQPGGVYFPRVEQRAYDEEEEALILALMETLLNE